MRVKSYIQRLAGLLGYKFVNLDYFNDLQGNAARLRLRLTGEEASRLSQQQAPSRPAAAINTLSLLKDGINRTLARAGYKVMRPATIETLISEEQSLKEALERKALSQPAGPPENLAKEFAWSEPDNLSAAYFFEKGMASRQAGDDDRAFTQFARANSLILRYEPARDELRRMSAECFARVSPEQDVMQRVCLLTRAIEMDPANVAARRDQKALLAKRRDHDDLTKMCFIFYDGERAATIHGEAYKRALEFVTIGGVPGDVLEFGVLGGWSSRIFAETMRDIFNLNNLHLFDSFEGLPDYESEVDRNSYEIAGRNVWSDKMKFPDQFLAQFGQPHQWHIRDRLSEIIRPERIFIHKGFYSETLKKNLNVKAAIVHLDCDLYQSTIEVLQGLYRMNALQDGCVLLFDDWNCNRANPNYGQRRALSDFLESQGKFSATPWYTYGYNGATYILHETNI